MSDRTLYLTPSLFDLFEETQAASSIVVRPSVAATLAPPEGHSSVVEMFGDDIISVVKLRPHTPNAAYRRAVSIALGDMTLRRYEAGRSFVDLAAEKGPRGWRSAVRACIPGTFEMSEPINMSANHKTFGDAMGTARGQVLARLRAESAAINGSFPPPPTADDDANALYWALGREDFRAVPDPEPGETIAPMPVADTPPELPVVTNEPVACPVPNALGAFPPENADVLVWSTEGAIAKVRLLAIEGGWIWAADWSTGGNSDVMALTWWTIEPTRERAIGAAKMFLLDLLSAAVIRGELFLSDREEHQRTARLYRRLCGKDEDEAADPMGVAA